VFKRGILQVPTLLVLACALALAACGPATPGGAASASPASTSGQGAVTAPETPNVGTSPAPTAAYDRYGTATPAPAAASPGVTDPAPTPKPAATPAPTPAATKRTPTPTAAPAPTLKPTARPTARVTPAPKLPPAPTPAPTPVPPPPSGVVTLNGVVAAIFAGGNFLLTVGPKGYTVAMSPTTSIVNLDGHIVPSQFIAVNGSVEVMGPLSGSTVSAQTVVVQTHKDF